MAGLIGASNSPLSGVGILAVLGAALLLALFFGHDGDAHKSQALIAYAIFTTAIVFRIATISNDNLQDLKTGQLVGATPWKQQLALVLGVVFGSLIIPPVLDLLNVAFGFAGVPGAGKSALPAPQAALISALARSVLGGDLDWRLIGAGAVIGVVTIFVDEALGRAGKMRLPPLAIGMGIYLPMGLPLFISAGALIGRAYERWSERQRDPEFAKRMGILMATGLDRGREPLRRGLCGDRGGLGARRAAGAGRRELEPYALVGGVLLFVALVGWLYRAATRLAAPLPGRMPR